MQVTLPQQDFSPVVIRPLQPHDNTYFEAVCAANPELRVERTAEGEIVLMAPTGGETGYRNAEITFQLRAWARKHGAGVAFDSSTAFYLPNGANRSPDASWVLSSRLALLSRKQKRGFLPLCPDFVIELTSPTERLPEVRAKMEEWVSQGAQLGWLIDADERAVEIYQPGRTPQILTNIEQLEGDGPVEGFVLELSIVWQGL